MIAKGVIERKKYLLLFIGISVLIYLLIKVLIFYAHSLSVVEFAFLAAVFGFAPAYFFRKVLKFENIIGWLVNSSVLGILFIPFLFVTLGWLGINFVFVYSISFLYICSLLGAVFLFIFADDDSVKYYFDLNRVDKIDILFHLILVGYTFILTLLNFYQVYIQWDAFTFWGLDAKYIFQLNRLRDSTLDVFSTFRYTAYYPVYYSIIYDIYGAVVEQYANWINVFLNFLALLLVYNNILHKSIVYKLFIVTMLIIVSYIAILVVYMFSMYADVLCAFNLLLFMMVLTADYEFKPETYSRRIFLLFLLAISLYFIKSPFIFLTCLLILLFVLYDFKFLLDKWNILVRRIDFWFVFAIVVTLYLMRFYYFTVTLSVGNNTPINDLYIPSFTSLHSSLVYAAGLISWLVNRSPYLIGMWLLGLFSVFVVNKQLHNKSYYYVYWVSFGVLISYCIIYIINQSDLASGSLVRYCAIVMYLIPLMFTYGKFEFSRTNSLALATVLFILSCYVFVKTMTPMPLYEHFSLSTGSYSVILKKEYKIAEETLKITGADARILIADDFLKEDLLGNMYLEAIFVRYFLMFNSVGGQYMTTRENLYDYGLEQNADYILLLSYANTYDHCEKILVSDHNYLIKIDKSKSYDLSTCVFSNNMIFDLSKK